MDKRKLLLSAVFAAGIMGTSAVAGDMQVLNEDDLEEVSAQGFQTIDNDTRDFGGQMNQENNLDSVQMNDNAQQNAKGADLVASATSSINLAINLLWSDGSPSEPEDAVVRDGSFPVVVEGPNGPQAFGQSYAQSNDQVALNHRNRSTATDDAEAYNTDKETQDIYNNVQKVIDDDGNVITDPNLGEAVSSVEGQDNNNNSVQLNDNAQQNVAGLDVENSAQSASNVGINIVATGDLTLTAGDQSNKQRAFNMSNKAEGYDTAEAYNSESEDNAFTQRVTNEVGETGAFAQNGTPVINVSDQDNNNNSVQLNNNAQENASGLTVNNNANSAKNFGVNIHASSGLIQNSEVSQSNDQEAHNHRNVAIADTEDPDNHSDADAYNYNKETQKIINGYSPQGEVSDQDNNNNSVQLNDRAQANATGLEIRNSAISAYNTGMNIMQFDSSNGASLSQDNEQVSTNMSNRAEGDDAVAYNAEGDSFLETTPTQYVNTNTNVSGQNNNNNSVQLNNDAQQNAAGLAMVNNSNSAQNTGINIMVDLIVDDDGGTTPPDTTKGITGTIVSQSNTQVAKNHKNEAYATDDATAYNGGKQTQNIRNAEDIDSNQDQLTIVDQNNNNNSTQLNDNAQQNATALEMTNMAVSAVNTGINIGVFNNVNTSEVSQLNDQTASNFENGVVGGDSATAKNAEYGDTLDDPTVPGQYVHNVHADINGQNNNNNSTQLNGNAQQNAAGLSIANVAKVALNSGINLAWIEGVMDGSTISQENNQVAGNHNNYAEASEAFAMNENKQRQWIENCYCANVDGQNNNQNSVQVNGDAQMNLKGWHVLNGSNSAVNMATNAMITKSAVNGSALIQMNVQRATNFSNTAVGEDATAGNVR